MGPPKPEVSQDSVDADARVQTSKVRRKRLMLILIALLVPAAFLLLNLPRQPSLLQRAAEDAAYGMRTGDATRLLAVADADEVHCSRLDEVKVRRAWEILMEPHLSRWRFVGTRPAEPLETGTLPHPAWIPPFFAAWLPRQPVYGQAVATNEFVGPNGKPLALPHPVSARRSGPSYVVLTNMILISSTFEDSAETMNQDPKQFVDYLARIRAPLEEVGVDRILVGGSCLSWDQFEERMRSATPPSRRALKP